MIWAQLKEAAAYQGIHPRLDKALGLLTEEFFETLGTEKTPLEGNALYATRFDYETLPYEETFFEAHRQYLDIHVMLKGRERVEIAHPAGLEEFTHEGDFWGYHGAPEQSLLLEPGSFLVVFPGDAHRLKIAEGGVPEAVAKAVFKIKL